MKGSFWCFIIIAMQILCWSSATSRPFPLNASVAAHKQGPNQSSESLTVTLATGKGLKSGNVKMIEEGKYKGVNNNIGSRPPSCEHKCYGCVPCEAIQVPTTSRPSNVGIQYANYEPEGWKCKCGPSFYSP